MNLIRFITKNKTIPSCRTLPKPLSHHLHPIPGSGADQERPVAELPGHDEPQGQREGGQQLLPRPGRQPGVRLHEAPPDHVRRQLSGLGVRPRPRQSGALPRHAGQPGVAVRHRGMCARLPRMDSSALSVNFGCVRCVSRHRTRR